MMFEMARKTGSIEQDHRRGTYYVEFRWVKFPTAPDAARPVRLYRLLGGAPIGRSRERAEALLEGIRAELQLGRPLHQIVSRYLEDRAPETAFRGHWQRFLEAKAEDLDDGEIGASRYGELSAHERRGYLDALLDLSIHAIDARVLDDWRRALQRRRSSRGGTLARKTVRHVVADVGTFLRWLQRYGEIDEVPCIPEVRLGQVERQPVPSEEALRRYLDAIPEAARGIFLIRAYNGLRMPEARTLRVGSYNLERDTVTLRWSKTGELPTLPVDWEVAGGSTNGSTHGHGCATPRCSSTRAPASSGATRPSVASTSLLAARSARTTP